MPGEWSAVISHLGVFSFLITGSFVPCGLVWQDGDGCEAWVSSISSFPERCSQTQCQQSLSGRVLPVFVQSVANTLLQVVWRPGQSGSQREDEKDKREGRGSGEKDRLRVHTDWWMCVFSAIDLQTTHSNNRPGTPATSAVFISSFSLSSNCDLLLFGVQTLILNRDTLVL